MNIRKYGNEDSQSLIRLLETVFPDEPPHNDPSKVLAAKLAIDDLIFVAEDNKQIIGACIAGYDGHRGWLYAVSVLPVHRRTGVGTSLIKHALRCLQDIGCTKVNLQIRSANSEV
ncbi:MAG: GNAT family N-acetyltransferase, partial [Spirochaetales bacterium]|nr:GNAT family N-acetyltransferase [Spirochaetales bacterium]